MLMLFLPCLLWAQEATQESEFTMSAQLRARGEYRNGALFPRSEGTLPATFINDRARLSMEYKRTTLAFKFSGQHVGVWGQDPQIDKSGRFMLNEAWAKLGLGNGFFAQLGRQALVYDDERILGSLDWNVSGRYHDLLKLGYENNLHALHLMLAFNQNDEKINGGSYYAPGGQPYKTMQTLWYHYGNATQPFGISLLAMNLGWENGELENPATTYMQTLGSYMTYKKGLWDINGSFYGQTGRTATDVSVSAWMGSVFTKLNLHPQWAAGVGTDYLSGTEAGDESYKSFNPLYGTHHKFYGTMDYFYASPFINGVNPGLWDNQLALFYKPSKKVDLSANYHYFLTAKTVSDTSGELDKALGSEIDLQIGWTIMPDVKLIAGYSFMLGTETMDYVKGGDHDSWQDWGWISLNITPKLFTVKK